MKVLLVDDDSTIQKSTSNLAKKIGIDIEVLTSGEDALKLLSGGAEFDFILMDNYMGGISGIEATSKIRALGHGNTYKIILMTADETDEETVKKLGFDGFQMKPMTKTAFEGHVAKYKN